MTRTAILVWAVDQSPGHVFISSPGYVFELKDISFLSAKKNRALSTHSISLIMWRMLCPVPLLSHKIAKEFK